MKITINAKIQLIDEQMDCAVALTDVGKISGMMNHGIGPEPAPNASMKMKIAMIGTTGDVSVFNVIA